MKDDYFPDATGDAPQGNRLGGGAIDMSGSGAWARNDLDEVAAPSRPASLSISNSTSTNTASTVKVVSPTSDSTLSPTVKESFTESIDRDTKSYLNDEPDVFSYEQFTVKVFI